MLARSSSPRPDRPIKLDRAIVGGLEGDGADGALASGIASVARRLGISVVAEGIERPAQVQALRRVGCGLGQGFWLARPLPFAELEPLLAADQAAVPSSGSSRATKTFRNRPLPVDGSQRRAGRTGSKVSPERRSSPPSVGRGVWSDAAPPSSGAPPFG